MFQLHIYILFYSSGSLRHILNNFSNLDCQTNEPPIIEISEENETCKKKFNSMKILNPIEWPDKDSIEFINYGNNELDTLLNFYGNQKKLIKKFFFLQ